MNIIDLSKQKNNFLTSNIFLVLLSFVLAIISVTLWKLEERNNLDLLQDSLIANTRSYASETQNQFNRSIDALHRLSNQAVPEDYNSSQKWKKDAQFYITSFDGIQSVLWVDPNYRIHTIIPEVENNTLVQKLANQVEWDNLEIPVWQPCYEGDTFKGYIVGIINISDLITPLLNEFNGQYVTQVYNEGNLVFSSENWVEGHSKYLVKDEIILKNTTRLNVLLAVTENEVNYQKTQSLNTLAYGLSFSFLTLLAVFFAQRYFNSSQFNELRYRKTLESMIGGCLIIGRDWRFLFVNETAANFLGHPKQTLIGNSILDSFPEMKGLSFYPLMQAGMNEQINQEITYYQPSPDGTDCWYQISIQPAPDGILVLTDDITDDILYQRHLLRQAFLNKKLGELGSSLNMILSIEHIYKTTYQGFKDVFSASLFSILTLDASKKKFLLGFNAYENEEIGGDGALLNSIEKSFNRLMSFEKRQQTQEPFLSDEIVFDNIQNQTIPIFVVPVLTQGLASTFIIFQDGNYTEIPEQEREWIKVAARQVGLSIQNVQLYNANRKRISEITGLREIDQSINHRQPLNTTLFIILSLIQHQLGFDAGEILLYDDNENALDFKDGFGFQSSQPLNQRLPVDSGLPGDVVLKKQKVEIITAEDNTKVKHPNWQQEEFSGYYGLPLLANQKVKGILEVFSRTAEKPPQEQLDYLETLAGQAAIAIDNYQLLDELRRSNIELVQAYDSTIEGWSQAMDLRDRETEGHTQRVTSLTIEMARLMEVPEAFLIHIRRGALLHDIGKLGVPDHILLKTGALSPDEWERMKMHPQYAFDMLKNINYLKPAIEIPYYHHEKWDGSGYPIGLKGDDIPLAAQIFAVVDVWDALTNDRPYRKAWSKQKTMDHILEQAGTHFNPEIIKIFLQAIGIQGNLEEKSQKDSQ